MIEENQSGAATEPTVEEIMSLYKTLILEESKADDLLSKAHTLRRDVTAAKNQVRANLERRIALAAIPSTEPKGHATEDREE